MEKFITEIKNRSKKEWLVWAAYLAAFAIVTLTAAYAEHATGLIRLVWSIWGMDYDTVWSALWSSKWYVTYVVMVYALLMPVGTEVVYRMCNELKELNKLIKDKDSD